MGGRLGRRAALVGVALVALSSCSFSGDDQPGEERRAFDVGEGDCLVTPTDPQAELATLRVLPCEQPHTQEAYALVAYRDPDGEAAEPGAPYPGEEVLRTFADGACAQRFEEYVGRSYADSSLFFTYLLPSPRSWQADDRAVLCVATTTGESLTTSVRGSGL